MIKESKRALIYGFLSGGILGPKKRSEKIPGLLGQPYRALRRWRDYGKLMLQQIAALPDDQQTSFMGRLTGINDEHLGRPLNDDEIIEEITATLGGGIGSTAKALSYIIFELARPEGIVHQIRLRKEIQDAAAKADTWPEYNIASKLPFLRSCIREALRKWPTIPGMLPRRVVGKPVMIDSMVVPLGTVVGMQNIVHQRDLDIFPEPMEYMPDRWMVEDTSHLSEAFTPFSIGSRACIGQKYASRFIFNNS